MSDPNADQEELVKNFETEYFKAPNQKTPSFQADKSGQQGVITKVDTSINSSLSDEQVNEQIEENIERNIDNTWGCKVCSRSFARRVTLKLHIETHLKGLSFDCPMAMCGDTFSTRNQLAVHKQRIHKKV